MNFVANFVANFVDPQFMVPIHAAFAAWRFSMRCNRAIK